jgi:nicotinamide mononucleotide (NMN) deamidase PncC
MWLSLLANKKLLGLLALVIASFSAGLWVEAQIAKGRLQSALESQEKALVAQCEENKRITSEVDNEQLQKINALSKQLANTKRMFATKCNVPVANSTSVNNGKTGGAEPAKPNGVAIESLLDIAADGEKYRITLISCQDFIRKAYER